MSPKQLYMLDVPPSTAQPHPQAPRRPLVDRVEAKRRMSAKGRVLAHLEEHGSASNVELARPHIGGLRFGGRLHELRREGWLITDEHIGGGLWRYRLIGRKKT